MGRFRRLLSLLVTISAVLATGCARTSPGTETQPAAAQEYLRTYLTLLAEGNFGEASGLYGGPVDTLQAWFPDQDPRDVAGLLSRACGSHLLQCLPIRSIQPAGAEVPGELAFDVEFSLPDGTRFVRGPCCGSTSAEMPDESTFTFRVRPEADGSFAILDLPPYVP